LKRKLRVICLSAKEKIATTVSEKCAALGSNCLLSLFTGDASGWRQKQVWIFTSERIFGLVSIQAEDNFTAFGIQGDLLLLSRGLNAGTKKPLIKIDANHYTYGNLNITFYDSDFAGNGSEETDVFTPSGKGACRLMLMDKAAQNGGVRTNYPKGTKHFYVVEVSPKWSPASSNVSYGNDGELLSLQITDKTGSYLVAYNSGDANAHLNLNGRVFSGGVLEHNTGEQFRPAWINNNVPTTNGQSISIQKPKSLNVGAGQILLLEQRD